VYDVTLLFDRGLPLDCFYRHEFQALMFTIFSQLGIGPEVDGDAFPLRVLAIPLE
jgi:hypothetical protein